MSSEELIRSEGGPAPMNATLRSVFEEDRYSPLDSAQLRLAPSSNIVDPTAKRCFTEAELAQKCPTLLYEKKPAPVKPTDQCAGYFPVDFGDGYVKDFGDTDDNGGFTPTIPKSKIEEYIFPTAPNSRTLVTKGNTDTVIKQGTLVIKMTPRTAQAVQSLRWNNKEYLKTPMFTTAAVDVPKGASDKMKRVGEASVSTKSTSKVVAVAASATAAFTRVQAAYSLPPGTILGGKRVSHSSTLSTTNITKNISIASNMVARYTAGVSLEHPFVSGRFNIPMFTLTPEFKKIYVYRKSKHAWETPTQAQLSLDNKDVLAIIFTNTSQTHAIGLRPIATPKPKKFGSTFNNKLTTNVARSATGVNVSTTLTVGTRGGNANGVYAPSGIYTVVQDNAFGTFAYVHGLFNKIFTKDAGGKCPPCKPIKPVKTRTVGGTVVKVIGPNQVQIRYTKPDKKVVIAKVNKLAHHMKAGEAINVVLAFDAPYAFKAISKKPTTKPMPKPAPKPAPVGKIIVVGTVLKVINKAQVEIRFTKPNKETVTRSVTKHAHNMVAGEKINVVLKKGGKYPLISISKKPTTKPMPKPSANVVVAGKVTQVLTADRVKIQFKNPANKLITYTITKKAHNMKAGEVINVTIKKAAPYKFVAITKKPITKPMPKPTPSANRIVAGRVLKVINANQVQVRYTNPAKKVITSNVTKNAHSMKVNEIINVGLKPTAPYAFVAIAKKAAPKPAPKPAAV